MQIDRSNYEIWLIDWLDGNLSSQQAEQVRLFLEQNPDISEEFSDTAPFIATPSDDSFSHKEYLKKSPSEISESQFDYLCAAYLENDLTSVQQAELLEIVSRYPARKKSFDLMMKTRLSGETAIFKNKKHLLKLTALQKVIRLSVTGVSAAAAISLLIIIFSDKHGITGSKSAVSEQSIVPDSKPQSDSSAEASVKTAEVRIPVLAEGRIENQLHPVGIENKSAAKKVVPDPPADSPVRKVDNQVMAISKVTIHPQIVLMEGLTTDTLVASGAPVLLSDAVEERGKVGKFISKTFREKILKEKAPADSPLKAYEVAEAGVNGLNKLLGWQMVLDMTSDVNGQPRSVYFSSKLLKVNAPVKKRESQP